MRILYFVTKSEMGGVSIYISQLSQDLKNKGNEVAIMAHSGGWLEDWTKENGIEFYPNNFLSNSLNPIKGIGVKKELLKVVNEFKPDIIHCNSSVAGYWGRSAIKNSLPTVFTAHGWAFTDGAIWWRKIVGNISERLISKYCSKIICVSENDRQLALKYRIAPKQKFITIHNGIDIENWETIYGKKDEEKRKLEGNPYSKKIRIVFVGRLASQKDPVTLIKAFKKLPSTLQEESNVFIIGDGPDKESLKKLIKNLSLENKMHLLGGMDREKLKMIYLSGDIYVLTTKYEGFPYTIIEAMSYGLPVIASDVGGCSEAVDSNCGFLVKRGDVDGVKNALAKLIISKELREKMGKAGYEKARKSFALTTMLQATEAVYTKVLEKSLKSKVQSSNKV